MGPLETHNPLMGEPYRRSYRPSKPRTTLQSPEKKFRAYRRRPPSKHVFLASAGAWCFLSVYMLMRRLSIDTQAQDTIILPPSVGINKKNPSIPTSWEPAQALNVLKKEFQPPFGFVMRDLSRRVLSRHVANSNVLVIAPDALEATLISVSGDLDSTDFSSPLSLSGTFVLHAHVEGHVTHAMNAGLKEDGEWTRWNTTLNHWWSSFEEKGKRRPNWILLAAIDPGFGWEDVVWSDSERFLQESTITYVVTAVRSRLLSNNTLEVYGMEAAKALMEKRYKMQVLQVSHYHVELDDEKPTVELDEKPSVFDRYGPNALLKQEKDIQSLLQWGAESARRYSNTASPLFTAYLFGTQGLDLAIPSRREYIEDGTRVKDGGSATQINLYKPIKLKQCPKPSAAKGVNLELTFKKTNQESEIHIKLSADGGSWSPKMKRWRQRSPLVRKIQNTLDDVRTLLLDRSRLTKPGIRVTTSCHGNFAKNPLADQRRIETHFRGEDSSLQVWYDSHDPRLSEAACARFDDMVSCKTRILPANPQTLGRSSHRSRLGKGVATDNDVPKGFDLMVIMLDPMSRGHLQRSMPQTIAILQELKFLEFSKYSAVGDNSGPNQAALYSGKPLSDRDGITKKGSDSEWLWDTLRQAGYVTLKGEDGCIENSNMLQSLKPNTTHGEALNQMFCFDFNRPSCLGTEPAASYLLRYGKEFVNTYGNANDGSSPPWAAFLHFVDSHEDTMTLSTSLDSLLADFLRELYESGKLSNALVMLISDHGLHYGPYFQTLSGRRERTEPLLYVHAPSEVRESSHGRTLQANTGLWTTPFDVYQTMLDMTVGRDDMDKTESLLIQLPDARKSCRGAAAIPERFCELNDIFEGDSQTSDVCPKTPQPPSILSFYADIPKNHRPMLLKQNCSGTEGNPFNFTKECICGTSHRNIYPCNEHPWGPDGINSSQREEEYFAIVKCDNRVERLDNRVLRRQNFIDRYHSARNVTFDKRQSSSAALPKSSTDGEKTSRSPDVLVLELDSVSKAHADRHLPLTRQFLKRHRLRTDQNGKLHCTKGVCALDFSRFSVVGPNSVANQVSALSGCVVSRFHESCFEHTYPTDECYEQGLFGTEDGCAACPPGTFPIDPLGPCNATKATPEQCCTDSYAGWNSTRVCQNDSLFEHNLQLFRRGPRRHTTWCPTDSKHFPSKSTPWLFDVARLKGYITYFGEEFCYDFSPYVTQDNTFPLHTDYELRKVHCRLQSCLENCEGPWPPMGPHLCVEHENENPAFSQLSAIWEAYPDVPKFAFLNGLAAHDYSFEWIKMISSLEAYDAQLASFLEKIVSRKEFENTIVVVKTDHGLQGGPSTVDYSLQVEHREPWTQLIISQDLAGESLPVLAQNQDRLATGYDLYHSIRGIMTSMDAAPIPDWSYNLFKSVIPNERSCKEAKIPIDFCPCEGVGLDRAPHFGVCNVYEEYNDLFCASDRDKPIPPESPM